MIFPSYSYFDNWKLCTFDLFHLFVSVNCINLDTYAVSMFHIVVKNSEVGEFSGNDS